MAHIWRCLRCSRPRMCSSGAWIEPSKWLRLWPQGSSLDTKKNWPCPLWQELFYSPQNPMWKHAQKLCLSTKDLHYSTTAKQYSEWRDNRQSFQVREEPSLSPFQEIFPLGGEEIEKEEINSFFSASMQVYTPTLKDWWAHSVSHLAFHAVRCRSASAYPKLHLAAGRPPCLASSARITNQRTRETGPKHHVAPVLI